MTTTPTIDLATKTANSVDTGPTNNDQYEPKVVALDDGRFVVVWTDNSDAAPGNVDGTDILAQVFDAFGNAVGDVTRVNNGWFNDDEGGFSVAALPGGRFVVAYEDTDIDGTSIRATEVTVASDASMTFANRSIVGDPGAEILAAPSVSSFADGSYMVVYSKTTAGTSTDAIGKIVSAGGVVGSEISIMTGSDDVGAPRNTTAMLTNGNVVIVEAHRISPDGDRGLFMRILNSSGSNVLGATEVAGTSGDGDSDTQPVVAALTGGGFVIAWTNADSNDDDILFQIYDSAGSEVGAARAVNSLGSTENYNEPAVLGLADGGFIIAYDDDGTDEIKMQRFDATGAEVGAMVTVAATSGTESAPTFALTGDGRIVISWLENNGGNNDIKFAIYDPRETTIIGDNNDNVILARLNENSTLSGLGGDDLLHGRDGSDSISGGDGNDTIDGGKGNDVIYGGLDNDYISGFVGNDTLAGQAGNDTIQAGGGDDKAFGNGGDDRVNGGSGNDTLTGSAGSDTIYGGTGADQLFGNADNDRLIGEDDNDKLVGLDGDDQLYAGKGDDTLKGGLGNDTMSGGAGADLFVFEANSGDDVVTGFSSAQGDVLQLIGITGFDEFADVQAAASQVGGDVVIDLGGGNSLTLAGVNLGDLHASDFLFG